MRNLTLAWSICCKVAWSNSNIFNFTMANHVMMTTVKKSWKYGEYRSLEHLLFLYWYIDSLLKVIIGHAWCYFSACSVCLAVCLSLSELFLSFCLTELYLSLTHMETHTQPHRQTVHTCTLSLSLSLSPSLPPPSPTPSPSSHPTPSLPTHTHTHTHMHVHTCTYTHTHTHTHTYEFQICMCHCVCASVGVHMCLFASLCDICVCRYSATKAVAIAMICTFFEFLNIPVFWPILVMYFIILFTITMKRQIKVSCKCPWYWTVPYKHQACCKHPCFWFWNCALGKVTETKTNKQNIKNNKRGRVK